MKIPTRKLFFFLSSFVIFLLFMYSYPAILSGTVLDRFNLDGEANIPAWYSTVLLFSVSLFSIIIYFLRNRILATKDKFNTVWILISSVYCFLSLDEAARIHEIIDQRTSIKWVYLYAPFAATFFLICLIYFWKIRDDKNLRNLFLGGLTLYATGGLFFEFISHFFYPLPIVIQFFELIFEEGLEMLGSITVLTGCFYELNLLYEKHAYFNPEVVG